MGALLSAHLLMVDKEQPFGPLTPKWYNNELLELAHELGIRLITAFDDSKLGIPHPRVCFIKICSLSFFYVFIIVVGQFMYGNSC